MATDERKDFVVKELCALWREEFAEATKHERAKLEEMLAEGDIALKEMLDLVCDPDEFDDAERVEIVARAHAILKRVPEC